MVDDTAGDARYGVCVLSPSGEVIAGNEAFAAGAIATTGESPVGSSYLDLVAPEFAADERERFARLVSGVIDYDDFNTSSAFADGRVGFFGFHRCAVRAPGADLVAIVTVIRVLRGAPDRSTVTPSTRSHDRSPHRPVGVETG